MAKPRETLAQKLAKVPCCMECLWSRGAWRVLGERCYCRRGQLLRVADRQRAERQARGVEA